MNEIDVVIYNAAHDSPVVYMLTFLIVFPIMGVGLYGCLSCLLAIKRKIWWKAFLLVACALLVGMVIYLGDWGNIIPTFVIFLAAICLCCEGSLLKKAALGMMFSSIYFALGAILDNFITVGYVRMVAENNLLRVAFSIALWMGVRRLALRRDFELSPAMWRLAMLLNLTPLGVVFCTVLLTPYPASGRENTLQNLVYLLMALFSFLGLLWMVLVLERQKHLEEERLLYESNRKYYMSMVQQNEEIRRLRHDMNNHLNTVLGLSDERREEYLNRLLENPQLSRKLKYCGDDTVNAVISSKIYLMEQKEIRFSIRADISGELSMEKPDICSIFGNALDNAIEAVQKLPKEQREIRMESRLGLGMLVLQVENPCIEEGERKKDGLFSTTKKDRQLHGYGLKSIRETAGKYAGSMETKKEEGRFKLFVHCRCERAGDFGIDR